MREHDYNPDHFRFPRQSGLPQRYFDETPRWRRIQRAVFWLALAFAFILVFARFA